jgi:hypothetical protein
MAYFVDQSAHGSSPCEGTQTTRGLRVVQIRSGLFGRHVGFAPVVPSDVSTMTTTRKSPLAQANPWIALLLTIGFLASFVLGEGLSESHQASGGPLHAGLALATVALSVWHLVRHQAWLGRVFRPGAKLEKPQSVRRVATVILGVTFLLVMVTGILCSRFLGMAPSSAVTGLHHIGPKLAMFVVIWHLVLCRHSIAHWFKRAKTADEADAKQAELAS